jgi:hypothetical protein
VVNKHVTLTHLLIDKTIKVRLQDRGSIPATLPGSFILTENEF